MIETHNNRGDVYKTAIFKEPYKKSPVIFVGIESKSDISNFREDTTRDFEHNFLK